MPKLSICIPTYNRDVYLKECLESIFQQINKNNEEKIEILISDNASTDRTERLCKEISRNKKYVRYFRNKKNIGLEKNLLKVGTYAKGEHIWFMSDDDLQKRGSINLLLKKIDSNYDIIFINLDAFDNKSKNILGINLLRINKDELFLNRRDFYKFLMNKFPYSIDWITTFYSILVIKKEILSQSIKLFKKYNSKLDMFPHELGIFYLRKDYSILLLAKRLVKYREGNSSWRLNDELDFLKYWDKTLYNHYKNIIEINSDVIPRIFKLNFVLKNIIRKTRLNYEIFLSLIR